MALGTSIVWEIRTAGNDTNGGGFEPALGSPVDYSQQDTKNTVGNNISVTDAVTTGAFGITSATAAFTPDITGNTVYLAGGTGGLTGAWYQAAYVSTTLIVVDRTIAASTGATLNIGGAMASPGGAAAAAVSGASTTGRFWVKAGTYSVTSASFNVSNGCVSGGSIGGLVAIFQVWEGYQNTRGDLGTKPILQATVGTLTLMDQSGQFSLARNLTFDGNGQTAVIGYRTANNYNRVMDCEAINTTGSGFSLEDGAEEVIRCLVRNCTASFPSAAFVGAAVGVRFFGCVAQDCTSFAFLASASSVHFDFCIADSCSGGGFVATSVGFTASNCVAYACASSFYMATAGGGGRFNTTLINCIATDDTAATAAYVTDAVSPGVLLFNCAGYNNANGNYNAAQITNVFNFQACTVSPFVNPTAGNFALNGTASGGALIRAAGTPGRFPGGNSTGYLDIGAVQSFIQIVIGLIMGQALL
jgi:hypothetical protein